MDWPGEERRDAKRCLYVRPVQFKPMGGPYSQGEILDISDGGARFRTPMRPPITGSVFQAWIPLSELEVNVPILGLVRWMMHEKFEIYQVGFQFLI